MAIFTSPQAAVAAIEIPSPTPSWGDPITLDFTALSPADWKVGGPFSVNSVAVSTLSPGNAVTLGPDGLGLFGDQGSAGPDTDFWNTTLNNPGIEIPLTNVWADWTPKDRIVAVSELQWITPWTKPGVDPHIFTGFGDRTLASNMWGFYSKLEPSTTANTKLTTFFRVDGGQVTQVMPVRVGKVVCTHVEMHNYGFAAADSVSLPAGVPSPMEAGVDGLVVSEPYVRYANTNWYDVDTTGTPANMRYQYMFRGGWETNFQCRLLKLHFFRFGGGAG